MSKNPVKITETVLRDGHQSLVATRMRISDMLPQLEALDAIGYNALEAWGGATFDTCLRFLNEDPWERLDTLKKHLKTPIQMLLRGQNLLGYNHYSNDVVEKFVQTLPALSYLQFTRTGYYNIDPDSTPEHLIFNSTVSLKEDKHK